MLISLVLSYKKCKKRSIGIYSEGLTLGVKIKLRNAWAYTREEGVLILEFLVYFNFMISFRDYIIW